MAKVTIILIFMIWLSWTPPSDPHHDGAEHFVSAIVAMASGLLALGIYARFTARRLTAGRFHRTLRVFNVIMRVTRMAIPAWFAMMVFASDYPQWVRGLFAGLSHLPVESPAFLVGTLPALLSFVGVWWAAYPAERALREQTLLLRMDANMPVRSGPTLRQYLVANVRLQLLFLFVPVLCILVLRDVFASLLTLWGVHLGDGVNLLIALGSMLPVMLLAPVLLVRVLPTMPLPESPLRDRLLELCRNNGLSVGNVLLWKTGGNTGNAAVMGMIPRWRYLLVTDLLLETMPDEQILAVFAHEIGHVMHRHLLWMAACAFAIMFSIAGPVQSLLEFVERFISIPDLWASVAALAITAPMFLLIFGIVVRRLERQADVFAARTILQIVSPEVVATAPDRDFVRGQGAILVCNALRRVAAINNVPVHAHEWLHGSIASRIRFLMHVSDDPRRTWGFDGYMHRLGLIIIAALSVMGLWTVWNVYH